MERREESRFSKCREALLIVLPLSLVERVFFMHRFAMPKNQEKPDRMNSTEVGASE